MNKRNPNITCEFTEADWEWWYDKERKEREKNSFIKLRRKYEIRTLTPKQVKQKVEDIYKKIGVLK